ncbi:MAG: hypothetical protein ACLQQ4_07130 [Bacteroidia bacterium]
METQYKTQEVTEAIYNEMFEVLPPIYVSEVYGKKVEGFAVSEPMNSVTLKETGKEYPTFNVFYKDSEKYYKAEAVLQNPLKGLISFSLYNSMEYTRNNIAIVIK